MSRLITLTDELKQKACEDFAAMLNCVRDGKISYKESFNCEDRKASVLLTTEAYNKIVALLTEFSDEVGWHGTAYRNGDSEFIIEDIFVYPQEVTGSTVVTDQNEYANWLYGLDDEVFSNLRLHGHSHVNMNVNPSGVDDKHRQQILQQLDRDMFYIFMVWNKSLNVNTLVYDMASNILYENKDVTVSVITDAGVTEFMEDAREKVVKAVIKPKKEDRKRKVKFGGYEQYFEEFGYFPTLDERVLLEEFI